MQVSKRALSAKERGRKGGLATAKNATQDFLERRSSAAGSATRDKYGKGFYRYPRSKRPKTKSTREKVQEVIRTIIPTTEPIPETTVDLITAAAKTIS